MANSTEIKVTNAMALKALRNFIEGEDTIDGIDADKVIEKIDSMLLAIEKKKSSKASAEKVAETEANKELVYSILAQKSSAMTASEIQVECDGLSNQKITSLLTKLKDDGKVENFKEKGKSYYKAVVTD
jgi:Fic family protein